MFRMGVMVLFSLALIGCGASAPPSPTLSAGPIAKAIHKELASRTHYTHRKPQAAMDRALDQLYAARGYRPLWNDPAALHALMMGRGGFAALVEDGLRPEHYQDADWVARASRVYGQGVSARERAAFELQTSRRYLRALSHVAYGKVNPASIGTQWDTAPTAVDQRLSLVWAGLAAEAGTAAAAFAQARPEAPEYGHLRTALALQGGDAKRDAQLRVNLERMRWLHRDLPASYVLVDIAGYRLRYLRPDGEIWESRVVVGKPYRETPTFRSEIDELTVNPTWTVPPTIFLKDIAPKAKQDAAGTLKAKHLRAIDGQGRDVPLDTIDWDDPRSVILRQDPGPKNPLGQIKISFDNPYQVYLHDTSNPERFEQDERADSSGCIRVEHALQLAEMLLKDSRTDADLSQKVAEGRTQRIGLKRSVPVLLHYATVEIDDAGAVQFQDDFYGRDPILLEALDRS
ncbi:MAG TPA: L,D-transpeptidase family protein [Solimonas sp.]